MTGGPSQTPPDRTRASASASRRRRRQAGHRTLADAGQPDKNARPLPAGRSQRPGRVQPVHRGPVTLWAPSGAAKDQGGGAPPPERQRACAAGLRPRLGVSSRPSRPPHRWETSAAQSSRGSGLPVMQRVGPVFRGLPHRSWSRPHPASHSPEFGGSHLGGGGTGAAVRRLCVLARPERGVERRKKAQGRLQLCCAPWQLRPGFVVCRQ